MAGAALVPGCADDPGALTNGQDPYGHETSGDPGGAPAEAPAGDSPDEPPSAAPDHDASFGDQAVARAREWIDAKMPYCGGPNGGRDVICGGTCERSDAAENPEWDDYRSDCSGFVSYAWALPAPGRTTGSLAPYDTSASEVIAVADLAVGDALNGSGHVMLFGGWVDPKAGKGTILEESHCGEVAHEIVTTIETINATTVEVYGTRYRSIRKKR